MTNHLIVNNVYRAEPYYQPPSLGQMGSTYHTRHQGPRSRLGRVVSLACAIASLLCLITVITLS
jgi:hypothetical protein